MFMHNKRLQYTARVSETDPGLVNLLLEQFGDPQGEFAAAMRYFTQVVVEEDAGRKDMLYDIATEELSHPEIIGTIVAMLNRGVKGELAEVVDEQAELYRKLNGAGNDSYVTQALYGDGPALTNLGGVPQTAAYIDSVGGPTADLRSNIAVEACAKIIYERLTNISSDPGVRDALGFLMTRGVAHQRPFEKALYAINADFPPGKPPPVPELSDVYFKMSRGGPVVQASRNSDTGPEPVADPLVSMDGGDGNALANLIDAELAALEATKTRLASDPTVDPTTGAELGEAKA